MSSLVSTTTISQLIAGSHPHVTREKTIASGQNLAAYSVLGIVSASGKYKLCNKASSDGSEVAKAVLIDACDATSADTAAEVVLHGEVDEDLLVFGGASAIADHRAELEAAGVYPVDRK